MKTPQAVDVRVGIEAVGNFDVGYIVESRRRRRWWNPFTWRRRRYLCIGIDRVRGVLTFSEAPRS